MNKLNLFIDSNIFLSFYEFSKEDLNNLKKLIELIKNGVFKIYITTICKIEVKSKRAELIKKVIDNLKNSNIYIPMPIICRTYDEYKQISKLQNNLEKLKSDLLKKLEEEAINESLEADKIINSLFEYAIELQAEKYLENAIKRKQLGKPPGQTDKNLGDAINWETLISELPEKEDLIIISNDRTFQNPLNSEKLHPFLLKEWKERKNSEVLFYRTLTDFFSKHASDIQLRIEKEKEKLIEDLVNSPNFATTHELIRKLSIFENFSDFQIKNLFYALINNTQIKWIAKDSDVNTFYKNLLVKYKDVLDPEILNEARNILNNNDSNTKEIIDEYDYLMDDLMDDLIL